MNRYGLFRFNSLNYGVPLLRMRKILQGCSGYRLPGLPGSLAEALVDDGSLVPVLRLAEWTTDSSQSARSADYKVLVETEVGTVAFPAQLTCGIVAEHKGQLVEPEAESSAPVVGIFVYQDKQFKILDIDSLALEVAQQI